MRSRKVESVGTLSWTCHILDPGTGKPYCGAEAAEGEGVVHGGLNSSNCDLCVSAAVKEPDAPPKCSTCDQYHHDRDDAFFHPCTCPFPRELCPWPPKCEGGTECPACRAATAEKS